MSVMPTTSAPAPGRWRAFAIALIATGSLWALAPPPGPRAVAREPAAMAPAATPRRPSTARECGSGTSTARTAATSARIIARARRSDIGTVYIKSGDGGDTWSQFNRPLVHRLHRGGLDVCAWQFVYGDHPVAEAKVGAASVRQGRRLPGDRRRGPSTRASTRRPTATSARCGARIGAAFPLSLAALPLRRLPPGLSLLGLPRAGRGPATTSRRCTGTRSAPRSAGSTSTPTSTTASSSGRSTPSGRPTGGPAARSLKRFRRFALTYGGRPAELVGLAGDERAGSGNALGSPTAGRVLGYRPVSGTARAAPGQPRRPRRLGAAAPDRPRVRRTCRSTGIFGRRTYARGEEVPEQARACGPTACSAGAPGAALLRVAPVRIHWAAPQGRAARRHAAPRRAARASAPLSASLPATAERDRPGPAAVSRVRRAGGAAARRSPFSRRPSCLRLERADALADRGLRPVRACRLRRSRLATSSSPAPAPPRRANRRSTSATALPGPRRQGPDGGDRGLGRLQAIRRAATPPTRRRSPTSSAPSSTATR